MLGTLTPTEDGRFALRFERTFAHSPEKVWRAITETEELKGWFPAVVDLTRPEGETVVFEFPNGQAPTTEGRIIRSDPPRTLEYTWGDELLRWELTPQGDGCHAVFTNVFDERESGVPTGAGWHAGLEVLAARLDGREVGWAPMDRAGELTQKYAAVFG
ncbi:SRPBCC family protein [Actinoalloteichus hymeniacidonis]|uniref:Activator of Hsp90 ATPase homologue 1/2-like C-terminal domain-containing protein n=1 Tax=Actinoalloteichus hymeniacidonis TaxID=340345 RepID=A0AAC9HRF2_9PSEU|nr:SRPBCC family protein [Actinoalloteichus hymeniacidonis]AOS63836.1 hypothetical protein TL08_15135 [Actinoalloteichus hymeniacidonis]MBB5908108.1 uncharacterized protein YndB with AHSA1/START domain [Actinoalloteichus hymeniacidonis]